MRVLIAAAATLLALAGVEAWTYWFGPGYEENFFVLDDTLGWRLRPGATGWTFDENKLWIRINADGLRDRDHPRDKPANTFRIAILGDSYMEAMSVRLTEMFAVQLEQQMQACASPMHVEVINFGVAGYGTAQELLTFERTAAAYQPDLVLTAIYFGNDLHNNHPDQNKQRVPFYVFKDGRWQLDLSQVTPIVAQPWRIRARMFVTAHSRAAMSLYRPYALFRDWLRRGPEHPEEIPWDDDLDAFRPPAPGSKMSEPWRTTDALLVLLSDAIRATGAEPWMVSLTIAPQVDPNPARRVEAQRLLGVDDLFYPERRLEQLGREHGLPTITLAQPLADYAAREHVYLHGGQTPRTPAGSGHWNPIAHRVAAGIVAQRLCAASAILARRRGQPSR